MFGGFIALIAFAQAFSTCDHDQFVNLPATVGPQVSRRLQGPKLTREAYDGPIRIHVEWDTASLNTTMLNVLKNNVFPYALNYFKQTLDVKPVIGNLTLQTDMCNGVPIPSKFQTEGVKADFVIFVSGKSLPAQNSAVRAAPCVLDAANRNQPIAGYYEINTAKYSPATSFEDNLSMALHQFSHILAFSNSLYKYFTKPDGTPYGEAELPATEMKRGVQTQVFRFPLVVEKVQELYKCWNTTDFDLEDPRVVGVYGSHWKKRFLNDDVMASDFYSKDVVMSKITLAVFEASGWYKVDYSRGKDPSWGANKGLKLLRC
mmetsp:Transcript_560/g.834  ORF Transcript_560/g.834 Transcript_560/m.834 type:complete len:317 (+) Transcript_560:3075-4025(+)